MTERGPEQWAMSHERVKRGWVWNQFFVVEEYTGTEPLYVGKVGLAHRAKLQQVLLRSCYHLGGICLCLATLAMLERNLKVILCASLFFKWCMAGQYYSQYICDN
ncbi:hypothetical protein PO909_005199 [Leuciscus waleckii]